MDITLSESDRDLNREVLSAKLEVVVMDAVRLVEQERGLELQTSFPESTLATMLPIVNAIESERALMIEVTWERLESRVKEPLRLCR